MGAGGCEPAGGASGRRALAHVLPRFHPGRAAHAARGDERPIARDGSDAALRPVQSRTADLRGAQADGYRAAVRAAIGNTAAEGGGSTHRRENALKLLVLR